MTKEKIVFAVLFYVAGWCSIATLSAAFATGARQTPTPKELVESLRSSQPIVTSNDDCADEQALVDYWMAIVEAAENSLMDAWDNLEECEMGAP